MDLPHDANDLLDLADTKTAEESRTSSTGATLRTPKPAIHETVVIVFAHDISEVGKLNETYTQVCYHL